MPLDRNGYGVKVGNKLKVSQIGVSSDMIYSLDQLPISDFLFDRDGREFWVKNFGRTEIKISLDTFLPAFGALFNKDLSKERGFWKYIFVIKGEEDIISGTIFQRFLDLFGPLAQSVKNVYLIKPFIFYGDTSAAAEELKSRTVSAQLPFQFLLRHSCAFPCFTVSFVDYRTNPLKIYHGRLQNTSHTNLEKDTYVIGISIDGEKYYSNIIAFIEACGFRLSGKEK